MTAQDEVRGASEQFYAALNSMVNGDAGPMSDVWSHGPTVTTMHPIGGMQIGWDEVRQTWEQVAAAFSGGEVSLENRIIRTDGDMAYETGIEQGQGAMAGEQIAIDQRVTNVYMREDGAWKIVHHHADISPAIMEVMSHANAEYGVMTAE